MISCFSRVQLFATPWTDNLVSYSPWDFPVKNTGVSCYFLLWGTFPTQELNSCLLCLLHWQADSFTTEPLGKLSYGTVQLMSVL